MEKTPQSNPKPVLWDCGSSLYDSFELKSFEKQLNTALVSRSLSMPHLSSDHINTKNNNITKNNISQLYPKKQKKPTSSKIPKSIATIVRSIFKLRIISDDVDGGIKSAAKDDDDCKIYVVYDEFAKKDFQELDRTFTENMKKVSMETTRSGSERF